MPVPAFVGNRYRHETVLYTVFVSVPQYLFAGQQKTAELSIG